MSKRSRPSDACAAGAASGSGAEPPADAVAGRSATAKLARGSTRALATLATCSLNQWALDFDGNLHRTLESIRQAKAAGARYRLGPELELPGYGCEDHFYEADTLLHSWQSVAAILRSGETRGIVCDIGSLVMHRGVRYNARIICLDDRILLIRPKLHLADDGNYREGRWFVPWCASRGIEELALPDEVTEAAGGQRFAPIGFAALELDDASAGAETCEELFTPNAPHVSLSLDGVEIIANGSGSHHELRKLDRRLQLLCSATATAGGVYLYANQQGCDGGRCYYDGCALIVVNGQVVAQVRPALRAPRARRGAPRHARGVMRPAPCAPLSRPGTARAEAHCRACPQRPSPRRLPQLPIRIWARATRRCVLVRVRKGGTGGNLRSSCRARQLPWTQPATPHLQFSMAGRRGCSPGGVGPVRAA